MDINVLDKTNSIIDESLGSPISSVSATNEIDGFAAFRILRRRFPAAHQRVFWETYVPIQSASVGLDDGDIEKAVKLLLGFKKIADHTNSQWQNPLVNVNDDEVVFEWWNGSKKITIYVEYESIQYIKVWGADIDNEMEDGEINSPAKMLDLWRWLFS
ncbi:MAG: hypothetical protein AAF609_18095 [Cyanobacteria bacterium P01_C01_bin.120]